MNQMETLHQLFELTVKDLYSAEKQFLRALPKLLKVASAPELRDAIESYIARTEGIIMRIKQVCELGGFRPNGKPCIGAAGLIEEAWEIIEGCLSGPTKDAAIVSSLQKCSTYELLSYSTAMEWAEVLGNHQIVAILSSRQYDRVPTDAHLRAIMPQLTHASARMSVGVSYGQNLPTA